MKVNVCDENGNVIARVENNNNLDFYDGSNWTCGSTGRHKGLTKLKDGRYVLIHGTQWQGEEDCAEIITAEEALQQILRSGNDELLEENRFIELKRLCDSALIGEDEGEE